MRHVVTTLLRCRPLPVSQRQKDVRLLTRQMVLRRFCLLINYTVNSEISFTLKDLTFCRYTSTIMAKLKLGPALANLPCFIRCAREKWICCLRIGKRRRISTTFQWPTKRNYSTVYLFAKSASAFCARQRLAFNLAVSDLAYFSVSLHQ
jgi:hypothetical protein